MRIFPAIGAAVLAAVILSLPACAAEDESPLTGKAAPEVAAKTLDGKDVKLSDQKNKVVVLDFWATWCPPCRRSLPHIQALSQDKAKADKGLVVWAVNAAERADVVTAFMKENKYTFTVPMDASGEAMKAYGVQGIPTTVIVGKDGKVKNVFVGFGGDESVKAMDAAIEKALAE